MKKQIRFFRILTLAAFIALPTRAQILPTAFPAVNIISPANHAVFHAPIDIPIFAYARPVLEYNSLLGRYQAVEAADVEFYSVNAGGTNDLGQGISLGATTNYTTPFFGPWSPQPRLTRMYLLVWSNALAGSNVLTAVARYPVLPPEIGPGSYRTSAPINITVLLSPPDTNAPDVASIVATDPVAVAGTNAFAWPGITNGAPAWTNWPPSQWGFTTNWGPRNALFSVRRFGDAGSDLTLNYSIGGTASNGVDYVTLPGSITVPAGAACAIIPVVPIDNGSNGFPKTVILTLLADTNVPPNYVVGLPPRAEALIVEDWIRPLPWLAADGTFHVNTAGPDGAWFSIQCSSDLVNWSPTCTNQVFLGGIDFLDPDAPSNSTRFYQAVPLPDGSAN